MSSKKELILQRLELVMKKIIAGNPLESNPTIVFENSVSYTDRQYINVTSEDINNKPMPWIIINNEGEDFKPYPSANFDNTLHIQIVGFVKATEQDENLDTLMNSLQRDILVAMLDDVELGNLCNYLVPRSVITVPSMIYPYGGFVIRFDIEYNFNGTNL
jgi:hypothetical protein